MSARAKHKTSLLRLPCITCGRYFRNQAGLTKHRRTQHLHPSKSKAPAKPPPLPTHADNPRSSGSPGFNSQGPVDVTDSEDDADIANTFDCTDSADDADMANTSDSDSAAGDSLPTGEALGNDTVYHPLLNGMSLLISFR
jgi:hypothetical protein